MAKLKFHEKEVGNLKSVEVHKVADGYVFLQLELEDGAWKKVKMKRTSETKFLIEVNGVVETLETGNCATIYGDVQKVEAGNCCSVEGFIKDFPREQSVQVDRKIKVCHGKERVQREAVKHCLQVGEVNFDVLQIEGDLTRFVNNSGEETVVHGRVGTARVGNCAEVKGTVDFASAGNRLFCTMGESNAKPTEELLQEEENRRKEVEESFVDFFDGLKTEENSSGELKTIKAFMN